MSFGRKRAEPPTRRRGPPPAQRDAAGPAPTAAPTDAPATALAPKSTPFAAPSIAPAAAPAAAPATAAILDPVSDPTSDPSPDPASTAAAAPGPGSAADAAAQQGPAAAQSLGPGEDAAAAGAAYDVVRAAVLERIDVTAAALGGRTVMAEQLRPAVREIAVEQRLRLSAADLDHLVSRLLDDMFGLGPIEPLLADPSVTDILINGPKQVYVERFGKLSMTDVTFGDNDQLTNVAQRIAASVGRRVDESSPLVDARLPDGSRVNIVTAPLAIDGTAVSIRKFAKHRIGFSKMVEQGNLSGAMAKLLALASRIRLNIIVSGGTGSGKTTLLNALSGLIGDDERVVTIEDAAELQLQQPHVVRLETRPMNLEGKGLIDQRQLVVNALRMRPDRIILGETRGAEAFDVLQAMNTGHDGSMTTVHANTGRDALVRLENMVIAGNPNLPLRFVRQQIVSAVHLVVQIKRMRDGMRRVTQIVEIAGVEGDTVATQELFRFVVEGGAPGQAVQGRYEATGIRPLFTTLARDFGLESEIDAVMAMV